MKRVIPPIAPDYDEARILDRPDGFYWQSRDNGREYGPFATLLEAVQDMQGTDEDALETDESLAEVEAELGVSDWIDPDTGELAEEESTRLEEH